MLGFRILPRTRSVSLELAARYIKLPVANVSDCMARMTAGGPALRPLHDGSKMAGPAITVKSRPGDNLMLHKAIEMAVPGDVLVVDAGGDCTNALMGELMISYAMRRGIAGVVINGAVRDYRFIKWNNFPVYAAGVTHRGPYKDGPGEINVPISIGGMVVEPGDLILGDDDGLICVPFHEAESVLEAALQVHAKEQKIMSAIEAGTHNGDWIGDALSRAGYVSAS
ncbi:RraA family protein [Paraburkholderia fynbosensis]|uniref:Putative 4-hydroxy-4-methyl-2-oxoglutarate aldolase n=1 Tax=Paraburkholderia fynbosensis TaxID=1200993 RepID=A0A6J5GTY5_9BURK|nr:RraA family protein [Paraburkholderia fynbosensis]CAB3806960.1 Regulator of ribonuclease activity A [Paraburkholderia fynbosensis]